MHPRSFTDKPCRPDDHLTKDLGWYISNFARISRRACVHARTELRSAQFELMGPVEFNQVWHRVSSVAGFSPNRAESLLLYSLARNGPGSGAIVEIGSYLGRSTSFLAMGSKVAGREPVIAIDPHKGGTGDPNTEDESGKVGTYELMRHNLRRLRVDDWVITLTMTSVEATQDWPYGPVRLLFIDGLHTMEAVSIDLNQFVPLLTDDAVVVFDDYYPPDFPGVRAAVDKAVKEGLLAGSRHRVVRYHVIGLNRSLWSVVADLPG